MPGIRKRSAASHSTPTLALRHAQTIGKPRPLVRSGGQTGDPYSEIKIWTMEGDLVHTLSGHTSFVYSISVLENGDIVSGGEDRTVRIWRGERTVFSDSACG